MSELTKNQLKQDNTNSFPNNNGGLITPAILRDFNNNMIDSLVDEVTYNIDSASFNSRINDLDPSGSQQSFAALEAATASLQIATASLNAYTASQNLFNSSATASIVALQNFSSSLDATFATDAQLTSLSSSIAVTDSAQSASIAALQLFSSSLDSTYATDAQLSASVSALSASVAVTDLSQSSSIAQLLGFSSSLDATFATDAQLNTLSSSIAVTDLSQSSSIAALQSFSSSLDATFATDAQLTSLSASIAVTDLAQSSSIAQLLGFSSSLDATYATDAQLTALSSSIAVTDSGQDSKINSLTAATSSYITSAQTASMSVLSSSFATTASFALTAGGVDTGSLLLTASFNAYTSSNDSKVNSLISKTGSYATTGSNTFSGTNTFNADVRVRNNQNLYVGFISENGIGGASPGIHIDTDNGLAITSSVWINGITRVTGSVSASAGFSGNLIGTSSFATTASFALNATTIDTSSLVTTSSFNSYTSSNDSKVNALISVTGSYVTESETSSFARTNVSNTFSVGQTLQGVLDIQEAGNPSVYTSISQNAADGKLRFGQVGATGFDFLNDVKVSGSVTASNFIGTASYATQALTASFALNVVSVDTSSLVTTSSFNSYTASASTAVSGAINSATQSLSSSIAVTTNGLDLEVNQKLDSASFNSYTQSNDSKVNSLIAATGSYAISSSVATITGLSLVTASISGDTITFTKGNGSTFPIVVPVASGSVPAGTVSSSAQISEFGYATTSSVSQSVSSLNAATSSYITSAQTSSMTVLSASFAETSSYSLNAGSASFADYTDNVYVYVKNSSGAQINKGTIVRITGAVGDNPLISTASWENDSVSANTLGWVEDNIPNDSFGRVITQGVLLSINTDPALGYAAGQLLYLSSSGQYTNVIPPAPYHEVRLGQVLRAQQNNGSVFVQIQNGYELSELHDVNIISASNGDLLVYRSGSEQWENSSSLELGLATTGSNIFVGNQTISASLYVRGGDINHISNNTTLNPDLYLTESLAGQVNIIKGWSDTVAAAGPGLVQSNYTGSIRITGSNNTISLPQIAATGLSGTSDQLGYISGSDNQILSNNAGIFLNTGSLLTPKTQNNILTNGSSIRMNFLNSGSLTAGNPLVISNLLLGGVISVNSNSGSPQSISTNILNGGSIASIQSFATNTKPTISSNIGNGGTVTLNHISSSITYQNNNVNATLNVNNHLSSSGLSTNGLSVTNNMIFGGSSSSPINIYVSGSQNSNTSRVITDSIIGGRNINISSSFFSSSNASLVSSVIVGNGLTVSASHAASTNGGTAFFGRFNDTGSLSLAQDIIFAVGTGTSLTSRRTGLWIDTGSNTNISGTLDVIGNTAFTGSVDVSGSTTTLQNLGGIALAVRSGSVEVTSPQGTGYFYSNLPITSSGLRINGTGLVSDLIVSGVFSGNSSLQVFGSSSFTGSVFTSASVNGVVNPLTISSQTASLDFSKGNFFTVQLVSGSSTHINPTNVVAGQTISVRLNTTGSGTVTFASSIKQASGSSYVPTTTTGVDVITMVTFDTSDIYISNLKNFS